MKEGGEGEEGEGKRGERRKREEGGGVRRVKQ
jgi:hypothetical protein